MELLEQRMMLSLDCIYCDVNRDGAIGPQDVLQTINALNLEGAGPVPSTKLEDVNFDRYLTSADPLCIINWLNSQESLRIQLAPNTSTYGLTDDQVTQAITEAVSWFGLRAEFVSSNADVYISSGPIYLGGGLHAGGRYLGGNHIEFNDGNIPAFTHSGQQAPIDQSFWKQVFSLKSLEKLIVHEIGHRYGLGHSNDITCIMHPHAAANDFCLGEELFFESLFGVAL